MVIQINPQFIDRAFRITKINDQYKVEVGDLQGKIDVNNTILMPENNPELFWKLLNDLLGIKPPTKKSKMNITPIYSSPSITYHIPGSSKLQSELEKMSAKEIIDKVYKEKGVKITNSIKSKAAIISKALRILR